jgi:hypothetical protein
MDQMWYEFELARDARIIATTCDGLTDFDTVISVTARMSYANNSIAQDDDFRFECNNWALKGHECVAGSLQSLVSCLELPAGSYAIVVSGFAVHSGNFNLAISVETSGTTFFSHALYSCATELNITICLLMLKQNSMINASATLKPS